VLLAEFTELALLGRLLDFIGSTELGAITNER
jgi:hypothetical protein